MIDPLVGTTVGHYRVLARLGGGGMGVVYQARDTRLERLVALKFLPSQWSNDDDAKRRFVREAQAASATDHPNICTIYSIDEAADGRLFIVMAHYPGATLKQRLEEGPLAVEDALEIATQAAKGLGRAHKAGVVHRDIKPSNLILTDDMVKIVDFGLAKFADSVHLTVSSTPVGTFAYMSPEQVRAEDATASSDVWALGVVLYEMLTGHPPFRGHYSEAIAHAIRHESPVPIRASRPEVPEAVERLVFRALHKDPAIRFANGRELALALLHVRGLTPPTDMITGPVVVPAGLRPTVLARPKPRRWWLAAALAAAVVALGTGVLWRRAAAPVDRQMLAVMPVGNQSGFQELTPYRLALTYALTEELGASRYVRPLTYARISQLVTSALAKGLDPSSVELARTMTRQTGAPLVIVPRVLHENNAWLAEADIQDAASGAIIAKLRTDAVASALTKDAAYSSIVELARRVEEHFGGAGAAQEPQRKAASRIKSLDAMSAMADGLAAWERQEMFVARQAFDKASMLDGRHPAPLLWLSRAQAVLGEAEAAADSAERANRLVGEDATPADALLARAMWATARRDSAEAEEHYRELVRRVPDEPTWRIELADFLKEQGRVDEAIQGYLAALAQDPALLRIDVDLCRAYLRRDELVRAREHAAAGLKNFRALGIPNGEAQALLCQADILRLGDATNRQDALEASFQALAIFDRLGEQYNAARANQYVGLTLGNQGRMAEAIQAWERALAGARDTGNVVLQAAVLMNLGVASEALGRHADGLRFYDQSSALNEKLGDEGEAARAQANAGAILVAYGPDPDDGYRRVQSAVAVFQRLGDRGFEVFGLRMVGVYQREGGLIADAERTFNRALAITRERGRQGATLGVTVEIARTAIAKGDYAAAARLLDSVVAEPRSREQAQAMILKARALARLGAVSEARAAFERAVRAVAEEGDQGSLPLLLVSEGASLFEADDLTSARERFGKASSIATGQLVDAEAIEAEAYLAYLDRRSGTPARAAQRLRTVLAASERLRRVSLAGTCRVLLARLALADGDEAGALAALGPPSDAEARLEPEVAAEVNLVRLEASGHEGGALAESARGAIRQIVERLQASVPAERLETFRSRPRIRRLLEVSDGQRTALPRR
jgi:tetratricopeptide (TPR) repeat protein